MLLALILGSLIGVMAGYFRKLDNLLMRTTDLFLALPLLPLLLVMVLLFREPLNAAFGPETGIFILIVTAIGPDLVNESILLPLVFATGAGAEMRQAVGVAVFAGMLTVTVTGLLFTPLFYLWTQRARAGAKAQSPATTLV
jgi:ABC-type nitrate/sulfonate/bicarbonate transport system permease component